MMRFLSSALVLSMASGCLGFMASPCGLTFTRTASLNYAVRGSAPVCVRRSARPFTVAMQAAGVKPIKISELPLREYIDSEGKIPFDPAQGNVGVYAIYDQAMNLRFVGQSRYCDNSLRCHLGRMPSECYHFKIQTVERPSRTILDEIKKVWFDEVGTPSDNDGADRQARWEGAINIQKHVELSAVEKKALGDMSSENTIKTLRDICRRVQQDIEDVLEARGFQGKIQFNPKLKEQGLLDVSSVKIASVESIGEDTKLDASLQTKSDRKAPKGMAASPM